MTVYVKNREDEEIVGVYDDKESALEDLPEQGIKVNTVQILPLEDEYEEDQIRIQIEHDDRVQASNDPEVYLAYAELQGKEITELHDWYDEADDTYVGTFYSAEEFAKDRAEGMINRNEDWPYNHIDWDAAADELLGYDYSEHDGHYFSNN